MSNELSKQAQDLLPPEPTTDLAPIDVEKVAQFREEGMPGLYAITEEQVAKMFELYLAGKPYTQISRVTKINRTLIMYMSDKFNWFVARREYLHELETGIRERITASRVETQDFLLGVLHMYQKKIGKKVNTYLRTDNEDDANAIDHKDMAAMMKVSDMLHKLGSDTGVNKPGQAGVSPVGLNVGEGVTITKGEDGTVEITPKQKTTADMLKQFADAKRDAEKAAKAK